MSYADLNSQRTMAFDNVRNEFYEAAIKKVVTTDSVVLDLGSGLGIHALMAARAGARRVFMVEPENVIHCAMEVAKHNGYGDRIKAFQGRIEEVELPEKVDVIISVFTGNLLYSEDLLPSLFFARDKWLRPGGTLIPDAAELMLAPVSIETTFEQNVAVWSIPHRGFDYSPLRRYAANGLLSDRRKEVSGELLAPAQVIATADFYAASRTDLDTKATFEIETGGLCHGLHAWIRIHLDEQRASTGPILTPMHWTPTTFTLDPPVSLSSGQRLHVSLHRPAFGEWTWTVQIDAQPTQSVQRAQRVQRSTFLAEPILPSSLTTISEGGTPTLSDKGLAAKHALDNFDGKTSNSEIIAALSARFSGLFASTAQAKDFVVALARRFCQ